jgi:uncharacterized membrane protein
VAAGLVAAWFLAWEEAWLIAWIGSVLGFMALVWPRIVPLTAPEARVLARLEDPSRAVSDLVLVTAAATSLGGAALTLALSGHGAGSSSMRLGLAVGAIVCSWAVVPTIFTLRYASLYYQHPGGGVDFHQEGDAPPTYVDFAYVAFTVAMTFQVSDTEINASGIRAAILRQALISYLFGAVVVAATINVLAGFFAH